MKLIRFGEPGKERPGLLLNDGTFIDTSGGYEPGISIESLDAAKAIYRPIK
jgi:hypothetical protein